MALGARMRDLGEEAVRQAEGVGEKTAFRHLLFHLSI